MIRLKKVNEFIRRFISSQLRKTYKCEKILGSRDKVGKFGDFYKENKEDFEFLLWLVKSEHGNKANVLVNFLRECSDEIELYRLKATKPQKKKFDKYLKL